MSLIPECVHCLSTYSNYKLFLSLSLSLSLSPGALSGWWVMWLWHAAYASECASLRTKCYWCVTGSNHIHLAVILHESKSQFKISFYSSDQFYLIISRVHNNSTCTLDLILFSKFLLLNFLGLFILQNMGGAGLRKGRS